MLILAGLEQTSSLQLSQATQNITKHSPSLPNSLAIVDLSIYLYQSFSSFILVEFCKFQELKIEFRPKGRNSKT